MKITIHSLGKLKSSEVISLRNDYINRLKNNRLGIKFELIQHKNTYPNGTIDPTVVLEDLGLSTQDSFILSEYGKEYRTSEFAVDLQKWLNNSQDINFVIGNAFGWNYKSERQFRESGVKTFSLSKLTLNHEHAEFLLWEQLYRISDLVSGGSYHK